ncbi:DUF7507 domain-containing protein [Flavobacterium cupriresistens]|uniref:DUF7507 domain-containing protein n=1 Tax=Flavobacterium cupriresistens TaxID=2893885 RepID=UPI003D16F30D
MLCSAGATGGFTVTASGGNAPYLYSIDNFATSNSTGVFSSLAAGSYTVKVKDANDCQGSLSILISEPATALTANLSKQNATTAQNCSNGSATVTATGGTAPYTYLWSNGGTTATITGLLNGTYSVTVTDTNGCTFTESVVVDCVNTCDAVVTVGTITNVLCTGTATGAITVNASSALRPGAVFTFTWSDGTITTGTSSTISNKVAGTYTVGVTINGTVCDAVEESITITEPASMLSASATATDENGPTTSDGTVSVTASGGVGPYTYLWNTGATTAQVTGLDMGTYTVTVTDTNGCTATASATVNSGTCLMLAATATSTGVNCFGTSTGTVSVSVSGGSGNFTYLWNTGATTATVNNLPAGNYSVTVTDTTTLCTTTSSAEVQSPLALTLQSGATQVLCNGQNNGSVDITVSGGTAPYTYAWSSTNGSGLIAANEDQVNLGAGTYNVTATDSKGCTVTESITITQPVQLTLSENTGAHQQASCTGSATGGFTVVATGGTTPYLYSIDNFATSNATGVFSGLESGSYTVSVRDAGDCQTSVAILISEPSSALTANLTKQNATTAQGCADGKASVTATGGTLPYSYLWNTGATTASITGLTAGAYSVTVTDGNGCTFNESVVVDCVNNCDATVTVGTVTNVLCVGAATGSITVNATSVLHPGAVFTFTWSDGTVTTGSSSTINNKAAGTYTVAVTINGTVCDAVEESITITEPASLLSASATATDELGPTTSDGTVSVTASGGVSPYTYLWNTGATTAQVTGLDMGTYTVTVTDANGCTATASATVNAGTCLMLAATSGSTAVSCFGTNTGTVHVSVTGGSGNFGYLWNTGATTATVSNLTAGTYSVTVTDNTTLCTTTSNVTVQSPLALSLGYGATAVLCNGQNNGSIDITVSGGTMPYVYAWTTADGSGLTPTQEDQVALGGGTYNVVVTDANGCTINQSIVVSEPASLILTENTAAHQQVLCSGGATGSFTVTTTGGNAPYLYSIDNFATSNTTGVFSSLTAGSYTVKVKDGNDCQGANLTIVITEPATALTANLSKQNATTANSCSNGTATVTATGGTAPYTYLWSNGGTTATITGLTNNTYSVTVTDTNGCTFTESVVVDCVDTCDAVVQFGTVTNVLCAGTATGSATVSASSALRPGAVFTFTWSDGTITTGTSSTISNKAAGTYTVSVTINGTACDAVQESITITEPVTMLSANATATDENGPTTNDGTVSVTANGGVGPYTYLWNTGATTAQVTGLDQGTYNVTVTDANGCTATASATVNNGTCLMLTATASSTAVSCFGTSTGTVSVSVSGGSGNFTYLWNNGATTATVNNLPAGNYSVTVTDTTTLCTTTSSAEVQSPLAISLGYGTTAVSCNGQNNGSIDITVSGGTTPYAYAWTTSDGSGLAPTQEDQVNLSAGTYNVTVIDANGCIFNQSIVVSEPASLILTENTGAHQQVSCTGGAAGSFTVTATGGTTPYLYSIDNFATSNTTGIFSGLTAGSYIVKVKDASGCQGGSLSIVILEPSSSLIVNLSKQNATTDQGCNNGTALVTATGGTVPYSYLWSNGGTTPTITGLAAGIYNVTVTDKNGCTFTESVVVDCVNNCDAIVQLGAVTNVLCVGSATGSATVSASSASRPGAVFTFTWSDGTVTTGTSSTLSNKPAGTYTVAVTINGTVCDAVEESITITEPASMLSATATATDERGPTTNDGTATVTVLGGKAPYTYLWNIGATTAQVTGLDAGTYNVTVTDANGCTTTASATVNNGTCLMLAAMTSSTAVSCFGSSTGSVSVSVTGGSGSFSYSWNTPANNTTATVNNVPAGTYQVTVTDTTTLCTTTSSVTVQSPLGLSLGYGATAVLCHGQHNGSIDITVGGGNTPYTYAWSTVNGSGLVATQEDQFNLSAGTYNVSVTDSKGCTTSESIVISEPTEIVLTEAATGHTNVTCTTTSNGSFKVTATGGIGGYIYSIDNFATSNTTGIFSGLTAGDYTVQVSDNGGCTNTVPLKITISESCIKAVKTATVVDNGNGITGLGDTVNYTITVKNTGNINLNSITLVDSLTDGNGATLTLATGPTFQSADQGSTLGNLLVGETATYLASYVITQSDVDSNAISNTVLVSGKDPVGTPVTDITDNGNDTDGNTTDDPTKINFTAIPVIKAVKTATVVDNGDGITGAGDTINYTITVKNIGAVLVQSLILDDQLTDGNGNALTLTTGPTFQSANQGSAEGTLKVGETATYRANYLITVQNIANGSINNSVIANGVDTKNVKVSDKSDNGNDTDGNTVDDPTVIVLRELKPTISLSKTGTFNDENKDGFASVGETISYAFEIVNTGQVDLFDIDLKDDLPGIVLSGSHIDELLVGQRSVGVLTAIYAITATDIRQGFVMNQAITIGADGKGNLVSDFSDDPNDPTNKDLNNDGNPDDPTIVNLVRVKLIIPDIITPGGDGHNDKWIIPGLELYPNNTVEIYNRWGIKVFGADGYGSRGALFEGYSDGRVTIDRNKKLPTGTYYYVLHYVDEFGESHDMAGPLYVMPD